MEKVSREHKYQSCRPMPPCSLTWRAGSIPKEIPTRLVQWTEKSLSHLTKALEAKGHSIKKSALAELLHNTSVGFHGGKTQKTLEGKGPPDRNGQFEHITGKCEAFKQQGNPIISVDCKKKELLGQFKNNGRQWQAKGKRPA